MQKTILSVLVVALLKVGISFGMQQYRLAQLRQTLAATSAVHAAAATDPKKPQAVHVETPEQQQKQAAAVHAERQAVEGPLGAMKVSSLMLGDPAVCIINKNDYAVGDTLPLPGGRKLQVTAIREDGIELACNGQSYHLNAPAAPDLAALRKAR